MARPRNFDEDKVLDAAMQTFWRHCYEATTTRMLEDATGVGIRGLFNAFGSKEHLFQKVLQRYCAMISAQLDEVFAKPGVAAIDMVFAAFAQPEPPEALAHAGCLMVNTIQDLDRADDAIRNEVAAYRALWHGHFAAALAADGIADAEARAEFLVGALWGALNQIKLARDKRAAVPMTDVVRQTVAGWARAEEL